MPKDWPHPDWPDKPVADHFWAIGGVVISIGGTIAAIVALARSIIAGVLG